jgi:hypothetical protein
VQAPRHGGRATLPSLLVMLFAAVGVVGITGCDSGSNSRGATATTTAATGNPPASTVPTTSSPLAPSTTVPFDPEALQVSGRSSAGATIEVTFDPARDPIHAQADADGRYDFAVSDLPSGETMMFVTAHPSGQPGRITNLAARFAIRRGGSMNSSAVTCDGRVAVTLNLDGVSDLRVVC